MGDKTKIEWTDATWNPTTGCDQVSPGCDNCYALTMAKRLKAMGNPRYQVDGDDRTSGPGFGVTLHHDLLDQPLRWKRPRRVFVNSMSDLFHPDVPRVFVAQVFGVMANSPTHTFQVLTKRPQRMAEMLASEQFHRMVDIAAMPERFRAIIRGEDRTFQWPLPNVWLGTSIESDRYTFRADHLRATPAAVRFISAEPLLGSLPSLDLTGVDWLIVGGESGPGARPMHPDWVRDLRDRTQLPELNDAWPGDRHTAFFFKQWGGWAPNADPWRDTDRWVGNDGSIAEQYWTIDMRLQHAKMRPGSKIVNGRELDGAVWDDFPS